VKVGDLVRFVRGNLAKFPGNLDRVCGVVMKDAHPDQTGIRVMFPDCPRVIHRDFLEVISESR